jgi:hypothetical protein
VAEVLDHDVEVLGHVGYLRFRQVGDPQAGDQVIHPAGGHTLEIAGRDDGAQSWFGPASSFQQPVREQRAGAEFGYGDVDGADAGVEVAVSVAIAGVGARLAGGGVVHAADLVGLGGQNLVDEALQHLAHEIRGGLGEQVVEVGGRVDMMGAGGHRGVPFRGDVGVESKGTCGGHRRR